MTMARHQRGATLLEALIAVLIFSIGILAIVGMQALAVRVTTDAKYRADASFLANQALGRVWGDPNNIASYAESDTPVAALPNGTRTVAIDNDRVTVTIRWQPPGDPAQHQFVVSGYVNVN
ncbi:MAG: type IV pilus modification protein PilV [Pseudomonadota bacterium]